MLAGNHLKLAFFTTFLLAGIVFSQDSWKFKKEKHDIRIYTKEVDGSPFKSFKGTMRINADMNALVAVYQDVDSYADWMPNLSRADLLQMNGDTAHIQYIVMPAPWPVKDRDAVYHFQYIKDSLTNRITIRIKCLPDYLLKVPGKVRIPKAKGTYHFIPLDNGIVDVKFEMEVDPGGGIPAFMVNWRIVDGPMKTLKRLKERVKMEKYRNRTFSFLN
jgi:hypothetical protein